MEELYEMIEDKIRKSGYDKEVDGRSVYDDICDGIEGRDNGTYIFMSKQDEDTVFEYNVQIFDDEFNLSTLTIITGTDRLIIDFDN